MKPIMERQGLLYQQLLQVIKGGIKMKGLTVLVTGEEALFTDPMTKTGGEKFSYPVPTAEACKGILESIYWKPSIRYHIRRIRVLNPIKMQTKGMLPSMIDSNEKQLAFYTYLQDVAYEIDAYFTFAEERVDLKQDFNEAKHIAMARRSAMRGGRRDVFLGSRECQAYVNLCKFGQNPSFYDNYEEKNIGKMFHSFDYSQPNDIGVALVDVTMKKGIIDFREFTPQYTKRIERTTDSPKFTIGTNMALEDDDL